MDRLLGLVGKDATTIEWRNRLERRIRVGLEQACWVQCVGMSRPLAIHSIYQPVKLRTSPPVDVFSLINRQTDGIIMAGPGRGKTTLLKWLTVKMTEGRSHVPILFQLRVPDAVSDMLDFIQWLTRRPKEGRTVPFLLFIDGYDEVTIEERKQISAALVDYKGLKRGNFYLTCRSHYEIYDLPVNRYELSDFTAADAIAFVEAFVRAFNLSVSPEELVSELSRRDMTNFIEHPLMLALVCILKTGPSPRLPTTAIDLITRAINTLTFRWDMEKGISRETEVAIDGEERVTCLKGIAYSMQRLEASEWEVLQYVQSYVRRMQVRGIDARKLLMEMAQWYGLLVPVESGRWSFTHRTIHDYLTARYLVDMSMFQPADSITWELRHAYAACLLPDATRSIAYALRNSKTLIAFTECLANNAKFEISEVTQPLFEHFHRYGGYEHERTGNSLRVNIAQDFFRYASADFIKSIINEAIYVRGPVGDVLIAYGLHESIHRRKEEKLAGSLRDDLTRRFGTPSLQIKISNVKVQFEQLIQHKEVSFQLADCFAA